VQSEDGRSTVPGHGREAHKTRHWHRSGARNNLL